MAAVDTKMFALEASKDKSKPTIIFLHGFCGSHLEYAHMKPYLEDDFNLVLVDLPGHSRSRNINFSMDTAVEELHRKIKKMSADSKIHLVGLSLGGFIALQYVRKHAGVVATVFASGATPFTAWQKWFARKPTLLHFLLGFVMKMDWLYNIMANHVGLKEHSNLRAEMKSNFTLELVSAVYLDLAALTLDDVRGINDVRIAAVAGAHGDDLAGTKAMVDVLRETCEDSKGYSVRDAIHSWDLQFPETFAMGVKAWIENTPMPVEYSEIV